MKKKKTFKTIFIILLCLVLIGVATLFIVNGYVNSDAKEHILSVEEAAELDNVDCIIVLGCQVRDDGTLSHMLRDRLMRGLEVYNAGAAPKLLMSGDHGRKDYDEVGAMKQYAIDNGVPSENVFMDHAGFSTYETVYRAKEIFEADKLYGSKPRLLTEVQSPARCRKLNTKQNGKITKWSCRFLFALMCRIFHIYVV